MKSAGNEGAAGACLDAILSEAARIIFSNSDVDNAESDVDNAEKLIGSIPPLFFVYDLFTCFALVLLFILVSINRIKIGMIPCHM